MSEPDEPDDHESAFSKLTEKQRAFVINLLDLGGTNETLAAQKSGYGTTYGSSATSGWRLIRHPRIQEAIKEEANKRLRGSVLIGASVLVKIATDPLHKDQYKAACRLLDQGGLGVAIKNEHVHVIEDNRTQAEMIAFIVAQAKLNGLDPKKLLGFAPPDVVDGNFVEVRDEELTPIVNENNDLDDPFGLKEITG